MQDSQNTAEAPEATETPEAGKSEKSALEKVAELLTGDDLETETKSEATDTDGDQDSESKSEATNKTKPKTLEGLAEALGVKVADLYEIEIPLGITDESESMTLGQFKDIAKESAQFEVDKLTWAEQKTQDEQRILRSNQELAELVSMLPKSALSEQFLQSVRTRRAEAMRAEEIATLDAIPGWKNDDVKAAERTRMAEHLSAYGFPVDYLDSVIDHRTTKYIRDNMLRQERIEKALAQVKTVRKPGHAPSAPPAKPKATATRRAQGPQSNVRNQVAQVVDILNSD